MTALAALIDLGFAAFHLAFWKLFGWPASLAASGALNAAVTQTLNVMLTFVFLAYGGIVLWCAATGGPVAPAALLAGCAFWALRFVLQLVLFQRHRPASIAIAAIFGAAAVVHGLAAW